MLSGWALGYYIGIVSGLSGILFIIEVLNGAFFGYLVGWALVLRKYGVFIWSSISLAIVLIIDWVAGLPLISSDRLQFMIAGFLIGLNFLRFRKQVAFLGFIGAICGLILGLNPHLSYGTDRPTSEILGILIFAVKFSILGMGYGRLLMEIFGWRPKVDDFES
jgi:hypothetical protein